MIDKNNLTKIFCEIDDFCIEFEEKLRKSLISDGKTHRNRKSMMSYSEVMTILIAFHQSNYRSLKCFYLSFVREYMKNEFPSCVSYNRFVELTQKCLLPLTIFLKMRALGSCSGISFIDSTPIKVCHNKRIKRNKVFKDYATHGKSTMGWFFGFKLHLVVNDEGEILNFALSNGTTDDRNLDIIRKLCEKVFGKLYGDKGYISKTLVQYLFNSGIHLVTNVRSNMKNQLMPIRDKILLRKRFIIETINDQLKNVSQIEHTRHRSIFGFLTNLISGLIAYSFQAKKPSLNIKYEYTNQLSLFY